MKTIGTAIYEFHSLTSKSVGVTHKHERVTAKMLELLESWFRDAIFRNPELVIEPCVAGGLVQESEKWMPWKTEFRLPEAGRVDVMLLSSFGRIGLVETKVSSNPEKRREVVAQLLEYSLALQDFDPLELKDYFPLGDDVPDYDDFEDKFNAGDFLLIVAGDELDQRAVRLAAGLLGDHLTSGWDLAMVDINLFRCVSNPEFVLIVPALRGVVVAEKRQVIRVTVKDREGATVTIERPSPTPSSGRREDIESDVDFLSELRAHCPERAKIVESVLAKLHELEVASPEAFEYGLRSSSANFYWKIAGGKARIIAINRRGKLRVWLDYLIKSGNEKIANEVRALAGPVLGVTKGEFLTSASTIIDDKNIDTLLALVGDIAAMVQVRV